MEEIKETIKYGIKSPIMNEMFLLHYKEGWKIFDLCELNIRTEFWDFKKLEDGTKR